MNDFLKPWRRRFRLWKNLIRLKGELNWYGARFALKGLQIPNDDDIRRLIQRRFPRLKSKPKGALSIIAIYHHYNWENYSLKPALEKFGRVFHYDWRGEFDHTSRDWRRSGKGKMNRALLDIVAKRADEERPDVIFTYLSGELVRPATVQALRACGVPLIHLSLNDKENFVGKVRGRLSFGSRDICRFFDLCWTSTEDALKKYCVEGAIPIYLPEGGTPEIHRPLGLEKSLDVSFVGQCYGNRPEIIRRLSETGIRIEAFGHGWPSGPLSTEDMVRVYSQSKINLGFGGIDGHQDAYCLKGRDFEIPMSGGLYLTEDHLELKRVYRAGEEIVTYRGFDDLRAKVRYLLENPQDAERIRLAGFQRARMEHTWEMRFARVFSILNLISDPDTDIGNLR